MRTTGLIAIVLSFAALLRAQPSAPAAAQAGVASSQPAAASAAPVRVEPAQVVKAFDEHLKGLATLDAAAREAIAGIWRPDEKDADARAQMSSVVAILSREYKQALDALDADQAERASEIVQPAVAVADFYVAAHARTLAARALLEQDRIAEGRKLLESLYESRDDLLARTFLAPEVMFLLGYCRLQDVDYAGAAAVFQEFEQRFPEAPDQYRLPARQMLQELSGRKPEGLGDVSDLMDYAGHQLRHARANDVVQTRQARAVELLDKLIEDAEQREQQQQQQQQNQQSPGGPGSPQGNRQPQRGADRSVAPPGQGRVGDLHSSGRARPGEQWGKMRPEERERVLQALRQNYPSRYRQLVEQYYKQLSKEE